jgi:uridine phosphorylase
MTQQPLYHIGFGKHELGAVVPTAALLCGDPERAQRIAKETDGVSCLATLSENRGLHSYLCERTDSGKFIASTSGMGAPSLSIVVNAPSSGSAPAAASRQRSRPVTW